ncbi:MAG: DNA-3-methyladenine glycosylase I [Acidimicrobiia bacterium]
MNKLETLDDGRTRCSWGTGSDEYVAYHDHEWGRAVTDRSRLFEKLCLEGFQAGLSWLTILRKRPAFREGFAQFDPEVVAGLGEADVKRLLADRSIVRHEGKIRSVINNARRLPELEDLVGALPQWLWKEYAEDCRAAPVEIASITPASEQLAAQLKKAGFTFVGPTTVYAFMQAMGLVNDHVGGCYVREECQTERMALINTL